MSVVLASGEMYSPMRRGMYTLSMLHIYGREDATTKENMVHIKSTTKISGTSQSTDENQI